MGKELEEKQKEKELEEKQKEVEEKEKEENETIAWLAWGFRSVKEYRSICAHWWTGERCVSRFMFNGDSVIARVVGGGTVWVLIFVVDPHQNYEGGNTLDLPEEDELGGNTLEMSKNLPIQRVTVQLETPG